MKVQIQSICQDKDLDGQDDNIQKIFISVVKYLKKLRPNTWINIVYQKSNEIQIITVEDLWDQSSHYAFNHDIACIEGIIYTRQ